MFLNLSHLGKRGIPGVNSDAYHFGYFEDTTSYRSAPPTHSQFDPLLETLYIFGGLVIIYTLFTCICFSLREYIYSFRNRQKLYANDSIWSTRSVISVNPDSNNNRMIQYSTNHAYPSMKHQEESINLENFDKQFIFTSLDVVQISPHQNSSGDSLNDDKMIPIKSAKTKTIYTIRELLAMKPAEYDGIPLTITEYDNDESSIENQLKFSSEFKDVDFTSARTAEKTILEIRSSITKNENHEVTRWIQIYRLIIISGNSIDGQNANIFLKQFNRFMDELIDIGLVFEFINKTNPYLSRSLVQMVLQYCYSHWNYSNDIPVHVITKFTQWRGDFKPEVQPHHVIFRFLINLQLGLSILEVDNDTSKLIHNKIRYLIKNVAKYSNCDDTIEMIELLFQGNEVSTSNESRRIFFEILYLILKTHSNCCDTNLFQQENFAIKHLIKFGLWNEDVDYQIREYSKMIHVLALSKNENIDLLWKDKQAPASKLIKHSNHSKFSSKELERPGSWKTTNSNNNK